MLRAVTLRKLLISETSQQQVLFLQEVDSDRIFPIVIGTHEATAIYRRLRGLPTPRPQTHDLLDACIRQMGGQIERIIIDDLIQGTFFAKIVIKIGEKTLHLDARPSDAVALSVGPEPVPIMVTDHVIEAASSNGHTPPTATE
jgi:bifunctional DNase/RNase